MSNERREKIARECARKVSRGRPVEPTLTTSIIAAALDEYAEGLQERVVQLETLLAAVRKSLREQAMQTKDGGEEKDG